MRDVAWLAWARPYVRKGFWMCRRSHVHLLMCDSDFARRGAFACICFALYVHVAVPLAGAVYFSCCCDQRGAVFPPA